MACWRKLPNSDFYCGMAWCGTIVLCEECKRKELEEKKLKLENEKLKLEIEKLKKERK